jgi:hypothetical protein
MSEEQQCEMDAGAFVLGRMDGAEEAAFRRHLVVCGPCREDVEILESAAAAMPLMAPEVRPAESLPGHVVNASRGELRAVPAPGAHQRPSVQRPSALRAAQERAARQAGRRRFGRPRRTSMGILIAAMVLTIGISFWSSPTRTYQAAVAWSPGGGLLKVDGSHAQLFLTGMPAPPSGDVYEVWLQRSAVISGTTTLFDVPPSGAAEIDVPGDLDGVTRVLVTAEPAGGSQFPSTNPVLVADLR